MGFQLYPAMFFCAIIYSFVICGKGDVARVDESFMQLNVMVIW